MLNFVAISTEDGSVLLELSRVKIISVRPGQPTWHDSRPFLFIEYFGNTPNTSVYSKDAEAIFAEIVRHVRMYPIKGELNDGEES